MEGYLEKWTNYIFGWQRRYFILHDGVLHYCKTKGAAARGLIHLKVAEIIGHSSLRFTIDTGLSRLHLKAYNKTDAAQWVEAIKQAQAEMAEAPGSPCGVTEIDMIYGKIGELCSVYAQMEEAADLIPKQIRQSVPGIERLVALSKEMKRIGSDTVKMLEKCSLTAQMPNGGVRLSYNDSPYDEADSNFEYEDALSHVSDSSDAVEEPQVPLRKALPVLRNPSQKINIWKVIKDSIGNDLSKIAVPVYFNEPISMLQRMAEDMTHYELLLTAATQEDSVLRMAYVACFAVSYLFSANYRVMKPFNPLLGETYQLELNGFRLVAEQVSHHPPIGAIHVDHSEFEYSGSIQAKSSFKGTYLQVNPYGEFSLTLKRSGDHYVWRKPLTNVHNLIFGEIYLDIIGQMQLTNTRTGDAATVQFNKGGWFNKASREVHAVVTNEYQQERLQLHGQWDTGLELLDLQTNHKVTAWTPIPYYEGFDYNYFFSEYTLQLNLPPEYYANLPRTDSRFRPDQRALENGLIELATQEKLRLEEKQRATRRRREADGSHHTPLWFDAVGEAWVFNQKYWQAHDTGSFHDLPDIM